MKTCRVCAKPRQAASFDLRGDTGRRSLECKFCRRARVKRTEVRTKEEMAERTRKWRAALRLEVFAAYGDTCACCGETEMVFLALDHVNEDGAEHRKSLAKGYAGRTYQVYSDVKKQGFPPTYQLLCHNCNIAKYRLGVCPHQAAKLRLVSR